MKKIKNNGHTDHSFITAFSIILLLIIVPITVGYLQRQQQTQQQAAGNQSNPSGPTGNWKLIWDDEFNNAPGMSGPSNGLAAKKWNSGWQSGPVSPGAGNIKAVTDPVQTQESEYYGPASIIFPGDNAVHLRMQKGTDNGGSFDGKSIESGMITTAGLMELNPRNVAVSSNLQPYTINGTTVLEIRARIPGPNAQAGSNWPVFWLTNAGNYGTSGNPSGSAWPGGANYSEEIDLTEWYDKGSLGSNGDFHLHSASEYGGVNSIPGSMQNTDMSLAYHIYTYEFTPTTIQLWVDGIPVSGITPSSAQLQAQWAYPQYLMIAFQAYSGVKYPSSATGQPNDMMINYVRVWQQCTTNCSAATVSVSPPSNITPTFNCLTNQPCTSYSPSQPGVVSSAPVSPVSGQSPSSQLLNPSQNSGVSQMPQAGQLNGNGGGVAGLLQLVLQFILQLLFLFSHMFGK